MGSCSSSKNKHIIKNPPASVKVDAKPLVSVQNPTIAGNNKPEVELNPRKSFKLQDVERISDLTLNDGKKNIIILYINFIFNILQT